MAPTRMQRQVLALRLAGVDPQEIADRLGIGMGAVYQREQRARKRLSEEQRARYLEAVDRLDNNRRARKRGKNLPIVGPECPLLV
jgi:transcriptional regulator